VANAMIDRAILDMLGDVIREAKIEAKGIRMDSVHTFGSPARSTFMVKDRAGT
jgi:hypothetical protein